MLIDTPHRLAPLGTELPANDLSELLARRLRSDTEGEVMFDTASRGRYATDASIYQIMPVGVLVPPPRANTGTFRSAATASAVATSSSVRGTNTPTGMIW